MYQDNVNVQYGFQQGNSHWYLWIYIYIPETSINTLEECAQVVKCILPGVQIKKPKFTLNNCVYMYNYTSHTNKSVFTRMPKFIRSYEQLCMTFPPVTHNSALFWPV